MTDESAAADEPVDPSDESAADDATSDGTYVDEWGPRRRRSQRQRTLLLTGIIVVTVAIVGVVWVVITALAARSRLDEVRTKLSDLRTAVSAGQTARADHLVHDIRANARRAHELTTGPAWWVAGNLPVVGSPAKTTRVIALQADRLGTRVLPTVTRLTDNFRSDPAKSEAPGASVPLDRVAAVAPLLRRADDETQDALAAVRAAPASWLSQVSDGRQDVLTQLGQIGDELTGANRAVGILLPMLGEDRPQRYFVGFLNEAESRGVGGIPGAFAIVTADHGRITFEHFGSDNELAGVRAKVDLGGELETRYQHDDPTGTIQNSDISPDFSVAGRIWASMWQQKSGQHVDGALAVDPTALSFLLKVTGPARAPDGETVSASTVVRLTQQTQYARFPARTPKATAQRKQYLIGIARAVAGRLSAAHDPQGLARALSHAARERRLVVWSATPTVESQLRDVGWAGTLGTDDGSPYSGFVVNNSTGSKLDYYVNRTMTYRRCSTTGHATATLDITNRAPRHGLPPYVTIRADHKPRGAKPGDTSVLLTYYASRTARIVAFTVDGHAQTFVAQPEGNTQAVTVPLELPVGSTRRIEVSIDEPKSTKPVTVLRQPLARSIVVTTVNGC